MSTLGSDAYGIILLVILFLILLTALRLSLYKVVYPAIASLAGPIGERRVARILSSLSSDKYLIMNDLLIPNGRGGATQIDHVVISSKGIFVIETKNYSGWIFGSSQQPSWTQSMPSGKKSKFQNPIHQNFGHIKAIEALIGEKYSDSLISIVAFSNKARINPDQSRPVASIPGVVYFSKLKKYIDSFPERGISEGQIAEISGSITAGLITEKIQRQEHVSDIKENLKAKDDHITSGLCPKCGGELLQRSGKYGKFLGCSGYPSCKFVVKVTE